MLEVLYATVLEPDLLEGVVDVPRERVWLIEKNGTIRPLADPLPIPAARGQWRRRRLPSPARQPRRRQAPRRNPR